MIGEVTEGLLNRKIERDMDAVEASGNVKLSLSFFSIVQLFHRGFGSLLFDLPIPVDYHFSFCSSFLKYALHYHLAW